MKRFLIVASCLLLSQAASRGEIDPELERVIQRDASEIERSLDLKLWSITQTGDTIIIESKSEMPRVTVISPAVPQASRMEKYRITLSYEPALGHEQYLELIKSRLPHLAMVNFGSKPPDPDDKRDGKTIFGESSRYLEEHPLPLYKAFNRLGKSYSVYRKGGTSYFEALKNEVDYFDAKRLDALLDRTFQEYVK